MPGLLLSQFVLTKLPWMLSFLLSWRIQKFDQKVLFFYI